MTDKKIAGVICEYNPFHNGHAYQIREIKQRGYDTVVAVMSGNTVQRGEFAIADKYTRANAALLGGVDLVLELPYPYSSSSTEFFATAGVRILNAIGVDSICFGSENGDVKSLQCAAEICMSEKFEAKYKELCSSSFGNASAYFEAYKQIAGAEMPSGSNDILGIAYLKAIMSEGSSINAEVIRREGSGYRDSAIESCTSSLPSATMLRNEMLTNGMSDILKEFMPEGSFYALRKAQISKQSIHLERSILSFFRMAFPSELSSREISEVGGGLAEKLCKVSHTAQTIDDFKKLAMAGKYTQARINRAILHSMIGATESDVKAPPAYTTILGFNSTGRELLGQLRKNSSIPIVTKPADAPKLSKEAERQSMLSFKADALFSLCYDKIRKSAEFTTASPIIIN